MWWLWLACACTPELEDTAIDEDGDGYAAAEDCDDEDPLVHRHADEVCNGIDDDCDGFIDDDDDDRIGGTWFYEDADDDGYANDAFAGGMQACEAPPGTSAEASDCDDGDDGIHPGALETDCTDPVDYDCDGETLFVDDDGDGVPACEDCDDDDDDVTYGDLWYRDLDSDGYGDPDNAKHACEQPDGWVADDQDCDDHQPIINPDGTEDCDDGLDNDCDGFIDDADLSQWWADADGDGYGDPDHTQYACGPDGYVDNDDDCDDAHADAYPGAEEQWYDDIDQDCLGGDDYDQDGDGYDLDEDCDDEDTGVFPGAEESIDGVDQDCDDLTDEVDASDAGWVFSGGNDELGTEVLVGDVNADGHPDLLALEADEWHHHLWLGPLTGDATSSQALVLTGNAARLPQAVLADLDGDGIDDVLTSKWYDVAGELSLTPGPHTSSSSLSATLLITGSGTWGLGENLASADVDGDGYADLLASSSDLYYGQGGHVYLFRGPLSSQSTVSDADATLAGENLEAVGSGLDVHPDMDADGLPDLIVGAQYLDGGASMSGAAYLIPGPLTAASGHPDDVCALMVTTDASSFYLGTVVGQAGDVDGDGYGEFLVSSPTMLGDAWLFSATQTGTVTLSDPVARITGGSTASRFGETLLAGDYNRDGTSDVLVTDYMKGGNSSMGGNAYLFVGPLSGTLDLEDSAQISGDSDALGRGGAFADLTGDGFDDLLLGAPTADVEAGDAGAVYVITGRAFE